MPRNRERRFISDIEMASWFVKGKGWTFNRQHEKYESSILRYPSESGGGFKRYHPTQKNLKMIEYLIKILTNEGDWVLDPFMGSGTVGVACRNTNRNFIGIELDEKYFKTAIERIDNEEQPKVEMKEMECIQCGEIYNIYNMHECRNDKRVTT